MPEDIITRDEQRQTGLAGEVSSHIKLRHRGERGEYLLVTGPKNGIQVTTIYLITDLEAFKGLNPANMAGIIDYGIILNNLIGQGKAERVRKEAMMPHSYSI